MGRQLALDRRPCELPPVSEWHHDIKVRSSPHSILTERCGRGTTTNVSGDRSGDQRGRELPLVRRSPRPKPPGPTPSTKASGGYALWRPRLMFTPPAPTTTARPPASWNRRPPERTLGPPSHPNDKVTTNRRPVAASGRPRPAPTLNTRGVKDRGWSGDLLMWGGQREKLGGAFCEQIR